jgi:amidophosphoribosyltransferase
LREAGAKKVHMRISSPPVMFPCYYGIDTPNRDQLIASNMSVKEISDMLGTDSLGYLSIESLHISPQNSKCGFCDACFSGNYPIKNNE